MQIQQKKEQNDLSLLLGCKISKWNNEVTHTWNSYSFTLTQKKKKSPNNKNIYWSLTNIIILIISADIGKKKHICYQQSAESCKRTDRHVNKTCFLCLFTDCMQTNSVQLYITLLPMLTFK